MSSQEFENMAVVGQVADIVHSFKEANSYLKRIKERRRSKPPPRGLVIDGKALQDLEIFLSTGQDAVRRQYERDYRRLGQPFATGDRQATEQLKAILIDLQKGLVANLRFAYQDIAADSQDAAIMCLMQLHQRVIMEVDTSEVPGLRPQSRREPQRSVESKTSFAGRSRNMPTGFTPEIDLPPKRDVNSQLPTPDHSPSEMPEYINPNIGRKNNPFRPLKPIELESEPLHVTADTLPTPPPDRPIGPPPDLPLPPLPDFSERMRKERLNWQDDGRQAESKQAEKPRKETQSIRTFLDRAFDEVENEWDDAEVLNEPDYISKPTFQEPHPGIEVDPSKVGEPAHARSPPLQAEISFFPSPPTRVSTLAPVSPSLSLRHHVPTIVAPPHERSSIPKIALAAQDHRLSTYSTATQSSQGANSAVSHLSRHTSTTSTTSWAPSLHAARQANEAHNVHNVPLPALPVRSKSTARVPDPIYEGQQAHESQTSLTPVDSRRPSRPETPSHAAHPPTFSPFPTVPRPPIMETQKPISRRQSDFSTQSGGSSSASAGPAPMPIRTIPPAALNLNNTKLHLPSEQNKFAGLCKSAWRAQIGDFKKAYSAEKRPAAMASYRVVDYMSCKSCDFSGSVMLNENKKKVPDRKIIVTKDSGIAYRWDFLFKSHLPLKGGVKSADAEYGCMFCCAEGRGTPIFRGMSSFISHIAEHRPGAAGNAANNDLRVPEGPVVDRMDVLIGKIMEPGDRWEVAFPAPADGDNSNMAASDTASSMMSPQSSAPLRAY